ncbi:MAG: hypothetical protein R3C46_13805 [Hyphomonadaceae bacterium]
MNAIRQLLIATGLVLAGVGAAHAQEAAGKWTGVIKVPGTDLPIIVTIDKGADGALSGGLESPSQAPGLIVPVETIKADEEQFSFTVNAIGGDFMGIWQDDRKTWSGAWSQSGQSFPLELALAK